MTASHRPLALITGASQGIGAAVARQLAPRYDLILGGRDEDRLAAVADELTGAGPGAVRTLAVELTDDEALAGALAGIERLDALVHSAGTGELGTVEETSAAVWRRQFDVNVVAVAEATRLLLPALRAAGSDGGADIVLVNSGAGITAKPGWGSYAASKFALRAFGDALRAEEAAHGIRVTSVHPGRVDTAMQRAVVAHEGGEYDGSRFLRPESVAAAVLAALTASRDAHLTELMVRPQG
ncbi:MULTISPECIES: SDR family oxidoreductase [Pseudonocardia]|uniref:Short chain dehydrogenase n=2 Tax=Pseudonocardia TaxID=1847 RepID=A0ABQ0RYX6_9PSEU|nr:MULTISPECIES: SDR family oxidoreductase [Pseudonocardia]OSY37199.1 putative oxidoreductase [Pseudonocardia autotrophica]TDN74820.1 short-subunit dehydrogenase [Pseudonocardia autotrophica]BBG05595.1 short chain dehydrogenase [Pseudonocardia autotrophica]GEC25846.1 short chain dehydrogenase [Pseudonocardia saturnea]